MNEENILKQAGLSEEQSIVYQALLDRGPQKASPLSAWTGIKRGLVYKILENLIHMGLVEKKGGVGTVAVFYPGHPSLLLDKIERTKKELELSKEFVQVGLGTLTSKYNLIAGKPNIQFFEGLDGALKVVHDTLSSKTDICAYIDSEIVRNLYPDINTEYRSKRMKKDIKSKIISPDTAFVRRISENDDKKITERAVIKINSIPTIMYIYDNKISYVTLDKKRHIGVIIEDPDIYKTHKALFEFNWDSAEKI